MSNFNTNAFLEERKAALLSMDEQTIRDFFRKYNNTEMSDNPYAFWITVHKGRTADKLLPLVERHASKMWLGLCSIKSMDDGDLDEIPEDMVDIAFARCQEWLV